MFRRKRKSVHLILRSHFHGEKFRAGKLPPQKIKKFIVEYGVDLPIDRPIQKKDIILVTPQPGSSISNFNTTEKKFLSDALKHGKKVVVGEMTRSKAELKKLWSMKGKLYKMDLTLMENPTLNDIKKYFILTANYGKFRHELIRGNIKYAIKKKETPIEVIYGSAHSLLSKELKKEGIESSRKIKPQVFIHEIILLRKLMAGVSPSQIKPIEYKRAFVSLLSFDDRMYTNVTGKNWFKINDKDTRFYALMETTMLNRLSEEQIDKIIKTKDLSLMFTFNGISNPFKENISRRKFHEQLIEFLNKYSDFQKIHKQFK